MLFVIVVVVAVCVLATFGAEAAVITLDATIAVFVVVALRFFA